MAECSPPLLLQQVSTDKDQEKNYKEQAMDQESRSRETSLSHRQQQNRADQEQLPKRQTATARIGPRGNNTGIPIWEKDG